MGRRRVWEFIEEFLYPVNIKVHTENQAHFLKSVVSLEINSMFANL